jgi:hypothetical protein
MMTIQDEGRHLADLLDESIEKGGMLLSPADCELAAKALRWFAVIADRLTERAQEEADPVWDEAGTARDGMSDAAQRLH